MQLTPQELLTLLPIAVALALTVRLVIGLRTVGVFAPALLALTAVDIGAHGVVGALLVAGGAGFAIAPFLDRLPIARQARLGALVIVVAAAVVGSGVLGDHASGLPMVVLAIVVERTWNDQTVTGARSATRLCGSTIASGGVIALALAATGPMMLAQHWTISSAVGLAVCLLVGGYRGLRLTEVYRFRRLLRTERAVAPS
jgi:7 transmembrane helices usually fused to an inactive transglutaminase